MTRHLGRYIDVPFIMLTLIYVSITKDETIKVGVVACREQPK